MRPSKGFWRQATLLKNVATILFWFTDSRQKLTEKMATICDSDKPFLLSTKRLWIRSAFFESVACVTVAVAQGATATSLPGSVIPLWPRANKPLQVITKSINHSTVVTQLVSCFLLSCHRKKVGSGVGASLLFQFSCAKCESSSPSTVLHRCLSRAIFWGRQIFFHVFNGKT